MSDRDEWSKIERNDVQEAVVLAQTDLGGQVRLFGPAWQLSPHPPRPRLPRFTEFPIGGHSVTGPPASAAQSSDWKPLPLQTPAPRPSPSCLIRPRPRREQPRARPPPRLRVSRRDRARLRPPSLLRRRNRMGGQRLPVPGPRARPLPPRRPLCAHRPRRQRSRTSPH